jgi:hypothetical protein
MRDAASDPVASGRKGRRPTDALERSRTRQHTERGASGASCCGLKTFARCTAVANHPVRFSIFPRGTGHSSKGSADPNDGTPPTGAVSFDPLAKFRTCSQLSPAEEPTARHKLSSLKCALPSCIARWAQINLLNSQIGCSEMIVSFARALDCFESTSDCRVQSPDDTEIVRRIFASYAFDCFDLTAHGGNNDELYEPGDPSPANRTLLDQGLRWKC